MAQPGKQVVDGLGDNSGPIAILDVGRMDHHTHTQARRVGHNMALATFDFLAASSRRYNRTLSRVR